ncbi:MAG TPA: hypothetical protein VMB79_00905 [Jatrophihabitans sp.]|nr:hypothetical protein [Jatrophihabitans sp.]
MAQEIRSDRLPEAEAALPGLVADAYWSQGDPSAAALMRDVTRTTTQLSDQTVLENAWAKYHDLSRLPLIPQLMADRHP